MANKHILRINDTWVNVRDQLADTQIALLTDSDNQIVHRIGSNYYISQVQQHWNGVAFVYHDHYGNDIVAYQDLIAARYVSHEGDTDTRMEFTDDAIGFTVGGVDFLDFVEGGADLIRFNTGQVDIDFVIHSTAANTFYVEGSSGDIGLGVASPAANVELYRSAEHPIFMLTAAHNTDYDPQLQFRTDAAPSIKASTGVDAATDNYIINVGAPSTGVGGTTQFVFDASGQFGLGMAPTSTLQSGTSNADNITLLDTYDDGATYTRLRLRKSDSDTIGTQAQTDDGDYLGEVGFYGVNNTGPAWALGARIYAVQDDTGGTPVALVPTNLILEASGAAAPITNQLVLEYTGNSGFGTVTPSTNVHIYENAASTTPQLLIEQDHASGDSAQTWLLTGGQSYTMGIDNSATGDPLILNAGLTAGASTHFVFDSIGRMGIGVIPHTVATRLLHVEGNVAAGEIRADIQNVDTTGRALILCGESASNTYIYLAGNCSARAGNTNGIANAGLMEFGTGGDATGMMFNMAGANAIYFANSGVIRGRFMGSGQLIVGSGTNAPAHAFADDLVIASSTIQANVGMTIYSSSDGRIHFSDGTAGAAEYVGAIIYTHTDNRLDFWTNSTNRWRIDSSGHLITVVNNYYTKWGASQNYGTTFNGTDAIVDYDLLNAGTTDYRIQQNGTDKLYLLTGGYLFLTTIRSGATQAAAGASANEFWKTNGHATLPDNVVMIGV